MAAYLPTILKYRPTLYAFLLVGYWPIAIEGCNLINKEQTSGQQKKKRAPFKCIYGKRKRKFD